MCALSWLGTLAIGQNAPWGKLMYLPGNQEYMSGFMSFPEMDYKCERLDGSTNFGWVGLLGKVNRFNYCLIKGNGSRGNGYRW